MAHIIEDVVGGRGGMGGFDTGGGLLGGLILGSLLGRNNGLFGNNDAVGARVACEPRCATQDDLNAQTLGDIKASIPFNEAQVQLALAGTAAQLTAQANANTQAIQAGQTAASLTAATNAALVARDIASVDTNVDRQSCAIQRAICDDGEKTRALITSNQIAELNQRLTVAQTEALELRQRNERDRDRHGVEITMTNNQNQNQLQFQAQAQQLNTLSHGILEALQSIRATNQAINIGAGTQTATPTNTNTNVAA